MPAGYTEQYAHHLNFFESVRSRKPVVEDAVFRLRAAGPRFSRTSRISKRSSATGIAKQW
jgi:hypothetical protein